MSVQNPHSPTCIIAGEVSSLATSLATKLKDISCVPYFLPTKISSQIPTHHQRNIITTPQLESTEIGVVKYIFYFAPESILEGESGYLEHLSLMKKLLRVSIKYNAKTTYISRDPNEYVAINDSLGNGLYKQSRSQIASHIKSLESLLESAGGESGYQTRVVVRDLVGGEVNRESPLVINGLFSSLPGRILTTKKDTCPIHPVDNKSVVGQIAKLTFSQNFSNLPYEIIGDQQITLINAALYLKKSTENKTKKPITIDAVSSWENNGEARYQRVFVSPSKKALELLEDSLVWSIENPTKESVIKAKRPKSPTLKKVSKPEIKKPSKKPKTKPRLTPLKLLIIPLFLFSFLFIPPTLLFFQVKRAQNHFMVGEHAQSMESLQSATTLLSISKPAVRVASFIAKYTHPGVEKDIDDLETIISELGSVAEKSQQILESSRGVISHIITNQKGDIFSQMDSVQVSLEGVFNQLSTVQASLSSLKNSDYSQKQSSSINKLENSLSEVRRNLGSLISVLKISAEFLGRGESKTYLVLLQNNAELRPTGGFIGSFALTTFENGKLLDLETFDVYSADGQLKGHVEPPAAIREHLGEANWYLRDSNWNPDFTVSARRAEWFLDKEMGRQVDGTIGINLYVIRDLLDAIGGVELADYQETITAENLFQRAEYFSELNYFDGSTQKKDFISSLISSIYFKVSSPEEDFGVKTVLSFVKNANQSHLQMSLRDESVESILESSIFSGSLGSSSCSLEEDACISDYISIIESNMGVNKVNYFVSRSINHKVAIESELVDVETSILLENKAETAAWPAGTYKNYIRFLVPENASIKKVLVGGKPVRAADLDISVEGGKKSVGFLMEIPISSQLSALVKYSLKHSTNQAQKYQYSLLFEKQSGTNQDPVNIEVVSSNSSTPINTSLGEIQGSKVVVGTNNNTDRQVVINYIQ